MNNYIGTSTTKLCEECASPLRYRMHVIPDGGGSIARLWFCPLCHPELGTMELDAE